MTSTIGRVWALGDHLSTAPPQAPPAPPSEGPSGDPPPKDGLANKSGALIELLKVVDRLRSPGGCPWDRAQTLESMGPYLLEETFELLEAVDGGSGETITEELGDLLFNVILMIRIATDQGTADLAAVAGGITQKMRRRHPHVWPPVPPENAPPALQSGTAVSGGTPEAVGPVVEGWERRKLARKLDEGLLAGVPTSAPALLVAHRQGQRVSAVGFDWTTPLGVLNKVHEELDELQDAIQHGPPTAIDHELGDVLMSLASLGRHLKTPAEDALRHANQRFARRFSIVESLAKTDGLALSAARPDQLEALWARAKSREDS